MEKEILYKELSYEDKVKYYSNYFTSGYILSHKLDDKLMLINLVCLVTKKMREQSGELTVKNILEKIMQRPLFEHNVEDAYLIGLAIVCEDMLYGVNEINPHNFKTSGEIVNEIKRIISQWSPF